MTKLAKKSSSSNKPVVRLSRGNHEKLLRTAYELDCYVKDLVAAAIEHFYVCPEGLAAYKDK
jgi:hypothetical protein